MIYHGHSSYFEPLYMDVGVMRQLGSVHVQINKGKVFDQGCVCSHGVCGNIIPSMLCMSSQTGHPAIVIASWPRQLFCFIA